MSNFELAKIFYAIADILEIKEVEFKPRAYQRAARSLEGLEKDVKEIYQTGGLGALEKIPTVGKNIALKIEEYIKTGRIKDYEMLKKESPVDISALNSIEGLGPRRIKVLYKKLGVKNIKDLEKTLKSGKIRKLDGFGATIEQNLLQGIAFYKAGQNRFLLGLALPIVKKIVGQLERLPEVGKISPAGSVRRRQETIGDIDILISSNKPEKVMDFFVSMPEAAKVWAKGKTKSSVRLSNNLDCDLRAVKSESFGAALQYFTGSKEHNIALRKIAIKNGLKLNEYGLFKGKKMIAGKTEKEIYEALGLKYIEPELRSDNGEIEAALDKRLPELIKYNDIKGDLQCHSDWSDGNNTILEMAKAAKELNYEYLAITDHFGSLKIANAMDEEGLLRQMAEIDRINEKISGIKILKGAEIDIKKNGRLDAGSEILSKLDLVIGAIHSNFKMTKDEMTERLLKAMDNPHLNIIAHPTSRIILGRAGYEWDEEKIFKKALETKTILEINAHYNRLDLKDVYVKKAIEYGLKLSIGTDAHDKNSLNFMELGLAVARRGWASKKDIINTFFLKELSVLLKK